MPVRRQWFDPGLHFTCTQCGACCTGAPGYVWMSEREAASIAERLRLTLDQFRRQYARKIGGHWSLRELDSPHGKDCVFLNRDGAGHTGCSIYSVRPQQCRTWPFWPDNLESADAWQAAAQRCPGMANSLARIGHFIPADQVRVTRDNHVDV